MSKYLEKEYLADLDHYDEGMGIHSTSYEKCKERLIRLASIDSANPSEALKELNEIIEYITEDKKVKYKATILFDCEIIKQALLKAQEPKQYLKWEDLEFKAEEQIMEVTFNGSEHLLCYYRNMFGNLCIIDNTGITIRKENKDFFNDLHLERVEENE